MPSAYHQLLDAAIGHLESLKQRGVRYVDASPEPLSRLAKLDSSSSGEYAPSEARAAGGQPGSLIELYELDSIRG